MDLGISLPEGRVGSGCLARVLSGFQELDLEQVVPKENGTRTSFG